MDWVYQALEEYSYITIRSLIFKIISVILTFTLIHSSKDVLRYGFLTIFTTSASNVCNFAAIRKYVDFKRKYKYNFKRHMKPILMLFTTSIIISIYANFDVSMIGFISTENEVGLYNAALKIKNIILSVSIATTAVIVPRIAYYLRNDDRVLTASLIEKSLRVSMILSVPLTVYIFIFADKCLLFLCGSDYVSATGTLRVLMACVIPLILTNLFGNQILIPCGQEKRYSQSVFIGLWINIFLNLLMIPSMGAFGAALGTLVTECWNVIWMSGGAVETYRDLLVHNIKHRIYIISLILGALAGWGMNAAVVRLGVFWQLAFTATAFFAVYYLLLFAQKEPLLVQQLSGLKKRQNANRR
jgi:O-antigen/teichoic acid export membrane protein